MRRTAALAACAAALLSAGPARAAPLDDVRALAALAPRVAGSPGEARAAAYVERRLRALGYRVVRQRVDLPRGGVSRNVVAVPSKPIRAVVVAHLDGVAAGPAANDNASGVAVLLALAERLRGSDGILFAALGAEERAETGSRLHLGSVRLLRGLSRAGRARIRIAFSLDMVGVGSRLWVRGLEATPNRSARALLAAGRGLGYLPDPGHSDHAELTRGGVPAAWLQWREDACWHRACDTAGRVDPARLAAAERVARIALLRALESRR